MYRILSYDVDASQVMSECKAGKHWINDPLAQCIVFVLSHLNLEWNLGFTMS